jgi:hypothetical protein
VARTGERKGTYKVYVRKTEGRDHLEDIGVDGRIINLLAVGLGHALD